MAGQCVLGLPRNGGQWLSFLSLFIYLEKLRCQNDVLIRWNTNMKRSYRVEWKPAFAGHALQEIALSGPVQVRLDRLMVVTGCGGDIQCSNRIRPVEHIEDFRGHLLRLGQRSLEIVFW